jgi:hypothetical protein
VTGRPEHVEHTIHAPGAPAAQLPGAGIVNKVDVLKDSDSSL